MITVTVEHDPEVGFLAVAIMEVPRKPVTRIYGKWRPTREAALDVVSRKLKRKAKTFDRQAERFDDMAAMQRAWASAFYDVAHSCLTQPETETESVNPE
jgi:hypothetical protein